MATELLHALARKAASAPEPEGTGRYHYIHTRGVHLRINHYLRRSGENTITGSVEPYERHDWVAADGSGRILMTKEGQPVQPSGDYGPGELAAQLFVTATDEDTLAAELTRFSSKTTTSAVMKAFEQVWHLQVVTPALQHLLLLHLAKCEGLSAEGTTVTHLDEERHRRKFLEFSPDTGMLLTAEEHALEGASLPISVPAVVSTTAWLYTGYRETTTPPAGR
ncbi:hypothetical protein ABZ345_24850 [Lentzea sp. NPDC005914]|uniref:hypothetical protein n=1 Tax=Lentzea sp. NPDC005914 TaxID=3154572 RepID=UPI0033D9310B